jgi:transcriptional regulator with XRE-family HTH domain
MLIEIKQLLKQARDQGMTDKQICKAAGVNHSTLWRWERGDYAPRLNAILKLQKAVSGAE